MNVDFYKELHNREFNRKKELDDAANLPLGLVTLMVGLVTYFINEGNTILNFVFFKVIICIMIAFLMVSCFFIILSLNNFLKGYSYKYLPMPSDLFKFENETLSYNSQKSVEEEKKIDYSTYLKEKFSEIATVNKKINDKRGLYLYRSKLFLTLTFILSLVLLFFSLIKLL